MASIKDGLYNYILQNKKFYTIAIYLILALVSFYIFCNYQKIILGNDINVFYYTFSTIVQGFLALIGFLGALSVYKLQLIETEATKVAVGLEESVTLYKGSTVNSYSWIEMMNQCGFILQNKESNWQVDKIKAGYEKLCKLRDDKNSIRNTMLDFSIVSIINIIFALIMLPLSKILISNNLLLLSTILLLVNILLSLFSAKNAINVIRKCLGYGFTI